MERLSKSLRQLKSLLVYHMSFFYTNLAETFKNQWCLEQTLSIQTISVMIILDYKPKGFVLVIFFLMENENMHMHMITGHLNVLKLNMNSCSFVSVMNSVFTR